MASERTYYNLSGLHLWFAGASLLLLATTIWMIAADHARPWREHQRLYRDKVPPFLAQELGRPVEAPVRPIGIEQVYLPDLTLDLHFQRVPRIDRCMTCHVGIDQTGSDEQERDVRYRYLPKVLKPHSFIDLFVGPDSPHPMSEFGCTVCHEGQGSATDYSLAAHWDTASPDWDRPMLAHEHLGARCAQCHLEPVAFDREVQSVERKVAASVTLRDGQDLVRQYGCFGCHEINGFDADGHRIGPDVRRETADAPELGRLRKVGPSLRRAALRMDAVTLADRIAEPRSFLPDGRMPKLFGLHGHLDDASRQLAERLEGVELRAIVALLVQHVENSTVQTPPAGSAERGLRLFEQNGCAACHSYEVMLPQEPTIGPDLAGVGLKYTGPAAAGWLAQWIESPATEHPRTRMPQPNWRPLAFEPDATTTTPAVDVAAYLMASRGFDPQPPWWTPAPLPSVTPQAVDELAAALGVELPVGALDDEKLAKLGSTVIARRGCTGCHDLPVDDGPPIGPELTGWASKHPSELAFERVAESSSLTHPHATFAALKLEAPRRFDYALADKKPYRDWLRMGRFPTRARESDAIVTFLLSLTADPPPPRYIATPDARQQTIIAGRRLVDELSCEACHAFDLERWRLSFKPGAILPPPPHTDWPLVEPQFTPEEVAASLVVDLEGERRAEVVGMPRVDRDGGLLEDEDDEGEPVHFFTPWEPALVDGRVWAVGGADIIVPKAAIGRRSPPRGGEWTRRMYPRVLADAQAAGATAAEMEAWGWLPPALHDAGARLQPAWLYEFLLRPRIVRQAAVVGMPRYALSTDEAAALADYFAARANMATGYPSLGDPRRPEVGVKLDGAMRILADRTTFCAKCHVIGDAVPTGGRTVLAPDLIEVQRRLRPEHLRRWLASPKSVLPYTAMPVNFPPTGEALGQDLLPGTASEQLDAVMELLLHYDEIHRCPVLDE